MLQDKSITMLSHQIVADLLQAWLPVVATVTIWQRRADLRASGACLLSRGDAASRGARKPAWPCVAPNCAGCFRCAAAIFWPAGGTKCVRD